MLTCPHRVRTECRHIEPRPAPRSMGPSDHPCPRVIRARPSRYVRPKFRGWLLCCQRDETRMEGGLHAVDMPTNAGHEHEPSTNDASALARRSARWLSRLNGWTASAVGLEQRGGEAKSWSSEYPERRGEPFLRLHKIRILEIMARPRKSTPWGPRISTKFVLPRERLSANQMGDQVGEQRNPKTTKPRYTGL